MRLEFLAPLPEKYWRCPSKLSENGANSSTRIVANSRVVDEPVDPAAAKYERRRDERLQLPVVGDVANLRQCTRPQRNLPLSYYVTLSYCCMEGCVEE